MSFRNFLSEENKARMRILNPDSPAYSHIDQKCEFCRNKLTKQDAVFPNKIMEAQNGEIAVHGDCLRYVMKKYPNVPITDLHGKIQRVRVQTARF